MMKLLTTRKQAIAKLLFALAMAFAMPAHGQQNWPGDINNNGIVNGVDLLYCGAIKGLTGGTSLQSMAWNNLFTESINYSRADVNGNGKVDKQDIYSLWYNKYGQTHGTLVPDVYANVTSGVYPILKLEPLTTAVLPGENIEFSLSLGDVNSPIDRFLGSPLP
jgi:hypothetical protein